MPDADRPRGALPRDWAEAFARLPPESPPGDGWQRVAARLDRRRRPRWPAWLATAAAVALAVALTLQFRPAGLSDAPRGASTPATTADEPLQQLYAESARLEALLRIAHDDRVGSATSIAVSLQLEDRLAAIDATLSQPGLDRNQQLQLWRQRVGLLRSLAGFESNRRLLAARGERYDGALVSVE